MLKLNPEYVVNDLMVFKSFFLVLLFFIISLSPLISEVLHENHVSIVVSQTSGNPDHFPTIGDAVSFLKHSTLKGGTINVDTGIYVEGEILIPSCNPIHPDSDFYIMIRGISRENVIIDFSPEGGFIFDTEFSHPDFSDNFEIRNLTIGLEAPDIYFYSQFYNPVIRIKNGSPVICSLIIRNIEVGASHLFQLPDSYGTVLVNGANPTIRNNTFINCRAVSSGSFPPDPNPSPAYNKGGALAVLNSEYVIIENNTFLENGALLGGALYIGFSNNITVSGNEFNHNSSYSYYHFFGPNHTTTVYMEYCSNVVFSDNLIHSSFVQQEMYHLADNDFTVMNTTGLSIINNTFVDNMAPNFLKLENSNVTLTNNIFFNNYWHDIHLSHGQNTVLSSYNYIEIQPESNDFMSENDTFGSNPYIDDNYQPIWNSDLRSPVIDSGDPNILDLDGTPSDIGAVRTVAHDFLLLQVEPNRVRWLSFPVLDRFFVSNGTETEYVLSPVEEQIINHDKIFTINTIIGNYNLNKEYHYNFYYAEWYWTGALDHIQSERGYRMRHNCPVNTVNIPVSGFSLPEDTVVDLNVGGNWVGYFVKDTLPISIALADIWSYVTAVYSEDWAWTAPQNPERATMEYGKAYVIVVDRDCDFIFGGGTPHPPNQRTISEVFPYVETDMYSVLMIEDIPDPSIQEIGVFLNGECIGASTVDEEPVQILAFTNNSSGNSGHVHFEFYYGNRGFSRTKDYYLLDSVTGQKTDDSINLDHYAFNTLSFSSENIEPTSNLVLHKNYPNPFNPETNINFYVSEETKVDLSVFNIKGQLVRNLYTGFIYSGNHSFIWNGKDNYSNNVTSGVYFYRLSTNESVIQKKMILLK